MTHHPVRYQHTMRKGTEGSAGMEHLPQQVNILSAVILT